jgi:hypothetical protein
MSTRIVGLDRKWQARAAYLVAARAGSEVLVGQVELLDTERAALILVIVDELVLLYAGHGVWWLRVCGGRRDGEGGELVTGGVATGRRGCDATAVRVEGARG